LLSKNEFERTCKPKSKKQLSQSQSQVWTRLWPSTSGWGFTVWNSLSER